MYSNLCAMDTVYTYVCMVLANRVQTISAHPRILPPSPAAVERSLLGASAFGSGCSLGRLQTPAREQECTHTQGIIT